MDTDDFSAGRAFLLATSLMSCESTVVMTSKRKVHTMTSSSILPQPNEGLTHSTMMAWRVHEFGPPEIMKFEAIPRPQPGPNEVLVKVEAAGVGPWDGWIRAGKSALP